MNAFRSYGLILFIFTFYLTNSFGQDATRFAKDVESYNAEVLDLEGEDPILFVGSSSIRMWKDVQDRFSDLPIVNRGFGGSQMSDLLYYLDDLVIKYHPRQVFIYEGDNDLASDKSIEVIMSDTKKVVDAIRSDLPDTEIVLIAAKPSVARWNLEDKYLALNKAFEAYTMEHDYLSFADVWNPALDKDGMVFTDIFLEDNLHMNSKGYDIWESVIKPMLAR